jgi:hypothetical protein
MQAGPVTTGFAEPLFLGMLDGPGTSSRVDNAAGFQYPLKV